MHNFKLQNMQFKQFVDGITIDFKFFRNFTSIEDIKRRCNPIVDLSKFTSNKKILSNVVVLSYNQFCS